MTETVTPVTLKHAAARLHAAKMRVAVMTAWWDEQIQALREAHAESLHQLDEAKIDEMEAAADLREAAMAEYEATGKKTLGHGVGIRVQKRLVYDRDQALRWAYANRKALALDAKVFEKIAKDDDTIDFVVVEEEPTVALPRDAAKLLGEG